MGEKKQHNKGVIAGMDFTVVKEKGYTFIFKPLPMFNDWNENKRFVYKVLKRAAENGCNLSKEYVERMEGSTEWSPDFVLRNVCFTHSFAKAFCKGSEPLAAIYRPARNNPTKYYHEWELFLIEMVLEINPIDYLRKFMQDGSDKETC